MRVLTEQEIEFIRNDLKGSGLKDKALTEEVLDHICCALEAQLQEGTSFEVVYEGVKESFGNQGLSSIEKESKAAKRHVSVRKQLFRAEMIPMVGLLVFLTIFGRISYAKSHPDIAPLLKKEIIFDHMVENYHPGVKFEVPAGTAVIATASGKVDWVGNGSIRLLHQDKVMTFYDHLDNVSLQKGALVQKGDVIGTVAEGTVQTKSYLFYAITFRGKTMNPKDFFTK